jgi:ribonuclease HI
MKGWAKKWQQNNWERNGKERAKNIDLWEELLTLCNHHQVEFLWVRGHSGNRENERCDRLAFNATKQCNLDIDSGYEIGEQLTMNN